MDFQLTPEQVEFREATTKLCAGRFPIERLRAGEGHGLDRAMWAELAVFGVFSVRQPTGAGGSGLGVSEAALVFEELGRGLVPGPLVWTYLAAGVDGDAAPDRIVGGIERGRGPGDGGGGRELMMLEHLPDLDELVVLDDDGIWLVDPRAVDAAPAPDALDPLTPVWTATALPTGRQVGGRDDAARWRLEGAAIVAAQLAGMAEALTDLTVAYTKERHQFGRPVGSFQSIKHLLADMLVRSELARTQAYAAAVHLDEPELGDTARSVSAAKSVAGRAAIRNGTASVQAHGGMGFTWEVDSHLYLKRAWTLDPLFGSADWHADRMATLLG